MTNQAVDEVRRQKAKTQPALKRSRHTWLQDKHPWTRRPIAAFDERRKMRIKTHRAYLIKERMRDIFATTRSAEETEPQLKRWYSWARCYRLEPMKRGAETRKDHWQGILKAFDSPLTNGRVEAITSRIQAVKTKARGYGAIRDLITIAYLVAGRLTQPPCSPFDLRQITIAAR